jgi:hypothetical protein
MATAMERMAARRFTNIGLSQFGNVVCIDD